MIFRESMSRDGPEELFSRLLNSGRDCFLLESASGPSRSARFSFLGADPHEKATYSNGSVSFGGSRRKERIDSFLRENMKRRKPTSSMPFPYIGGFVGYFSYDTVRQFEKLPDRHSGSSFPDAELGLFTDGFIFDHVAGKSYYFSWDDDREKEFVSADRLEKEQVHTRLEPLQTKSSYIESVERAKEYIRDGDIFQVVLSRRLSMKGTRGMLPFYSALKALNPSPYMYYVKFGGREVIGSSPETLVSVTGRKVVTYPIAGTRPVSSNIAQDAALEAELLNDAKERAEHNMLVDLARNDVGRVSRFGSVSVPEYMTVQKYSHVRHIVSRVEGTLGSGKNAVDAFFSVFPAGTVSGAPKIRAMEIIEELEKYRRGPYAGAVGYYSFNGSLDSAISIRTLFRNGSDAFLQAGGGIVHDSVPEKEYAETESKLGALLTVFGSGSG